MDAFSVKLEVIHSLRTFYISSSSFMLLSVTTDVFGINSGAG